MVCGLHEIQPLDKIYSLRDIQRGAFRKISSLKSTPKLEFIKIWSLKSARRNSVIKSCTYMK